MDSLRFDRFARALGAHQARRIFLRAALGGVLAGRLGQATEVDAARCKRLRQRCQSTKECCGHQRLCRNVPTCSGGRYCCAKAVEPCTFGCDCCGMLYCAYSSCDPTQTRCCHQAGKPCNNNCVCCTGLTCVSGVCQ